MLRIKNDKKKLASSNSRHKRWTNVTIKKFNKKSLPTINFFIILTFFFPRLGHIPEGGASLSLPAPNSSLKELFLFGESIIYFGDC